MEVARRSAKTGCEKKGTIYQLTCKCGEYYIGESGKPLAERINEHGRAAEKPWMKSYRTSVWAKHSKEKHDGKALELSLEVLTTERNMARRKALEAIYINSKHPSLNVKEELTDFVADFGTSWQKGQTLIKNRGIDEGFLLSLFFFTCSVPLFLFSLYSSLKRLFVFILTPTSIM